MNVSLNASAYLYNPQGGALPEITATIRDIGTVEALYFAFVVWVVAVVFHEFGHWLYLLSKNPHAKMTVTRAGIGLKLQTGEEEDYLTLTKDEKVQLYLIGIMAGFIPIVIAGIIHPIYWLVIPGYIAGVYRDMQLIVRTLRTENTV